VRKGILLAGGAGTRLHPITAAVSKQLMPVYDKPTVYYPLSVLMLAGVRDILVITTPHDEPAFRRLLGDGSQWGIRLDYAVQPEPGGIAQAYLIAADYLAGGPSVLILGDNIFYGHALAELLQRADARDAGATVFAYRVAEPQRYGVVGLAADGTAASLEEKPAQPASSYAVTGIYFYDGRAPELAQRLRPSPRGELEITDLNRAYLDEGLLNVEVMGAGYAWLDTGTHASLLDAALFIKIIEDRQGLKICCPEEVAWRMGFITDDQLIRLAEPLRASGYGGYLLRVMERGHGR
jgi:glucose-1-phosphate thymidylyltransferase